MAITPRFEADIGADISKFMRNMATVDRKIRDAASGVIIGIGANIRDFMSDVESVRSEIEHLNRGADIRINGDISDLERAIAEANAGLVGLNNDSTININGNSSNFDRAARDVSRQTNTLSRRITEARIGADIGSFESRMVEVVRSLAETGETVTPEIELEMTRFTRDINDVQSRMREIARSTANPQVEADIAGFMAQMAMVQAQLADVTEVHDIDIRADTGRVTARLSILWLQLRAFTTRDFVVKLRASWANYQAVMGAMASFSRNFGEIVGMTTRGITIAMSPAIVPVLASVVGLLGQLGPMLGVIGGSSFALLSSFGAAGIGAAGFAAVAIPSIGKVVETSQELKDIEEKIAKADTWKERNKLMKEQSGILNGMSDAQAKAGEALNAFKDNYSKLAKDMEKPVLAVFASGLTGITGLLDLARPMIENVTGSMKNLVDSFNANLEAADVKDFFKFLGDFAGPALETIGKAVGNFTQGLFNMMEAFGPLATETQNSFLKMSESFRSWADGLSESKKFQSFVSYVSENMPKIRSIFSDAIQGMINMFAAFAPSSADMMSGLQDMMERFKEWSAALGESQGFKNFIDYIQTNGPVVVSTIGEIVTFIINLGKAAAPIGEKMLGIINSMADFSNKMLEAHPWLGKIAIGMVVVGGAFLAAMPILVGLNALLGGFITKMIFWVARTVWAAAVQVTKWTWMGVKATANAIRIAAAWTLATGKALVVAVAKMIASAAVFVAKWIWMGVQALLHAAKVAAAWTLATGVKMVVALAKMVASAAVFVAKWLWMGVQSLLHAAKVAAAWALSTGTAMVVALGKMLATSAVFVAKWVWMGVQALLQAARMAAAWFIALGPVGWVIGIIVGLAILIIANWDKISAWTKKTWSTVSEWISTKWSEIKSKTTEAASAMWNTIKEKFTSIVNSVKEKMANAKTTIQNKWEEAKSAAITKLTALVTSVIKFFTQIVTKVKEKMGEAVTNVGEKVGEMPGEVTSFVGDMLSAGADLIQGLIDGAVGMASDAIGAVKRIAGDMVDAALSFFKIKSPSRVFMEMGAYLSEGLAVGVGDKAKSAINSVTDVARDMTNAFNPQLAMADMRASAQLDTSINRADMGVVRKSFAAEIGKFEKQEPDTYLMVDGKELGKVVARPVQEENDRRGNMIKIGRGR